ncbi:EI24 domain-containing protein [Rhodobacteraceae bacterium KMM 6894]|nr:EI24 domain-containing protein [Rhodobacteraceae bacterium KMM 6894]
MIFTSFARALNQMGDARFRSVLMLGVGLSIALLVVVYMLFLGLISWAMGDSTTLPLIGEVRWLDDAAGWGGLIVMLIASAFLMVPVASAITSLFLDRVAQAVEDRHYPSLPPARPVGIIEGLRDSVVFLGVLIAANLLALIAYLLLPFAALAIFWGVNGYLLGREYFQLVAMRRMTPDAARALRKRHWLRIWGAGVLMAMPLTVPLINLLIPVLGAATFTHLVHALPPGPGRTARTGQRRAT